MLKKKGDHIVYYMVGDIDMDVFVNGYIYQWCIAVDLGYISSVDGYKT